MIKQETGEEEMKTTDNTFGEIKAKSECQRFFQNKEEIWDLKGTNMKCDQLKTKGQYSIWVNSILEEPVPEVTALRLENKLTTKQKAKNRSNCQRCFFSFLFIIPSSFYFTI